MKKLVALLVLGVSLFSGAFAAQADQITLGRTILLEHGNRGAQIPLLICRKVDAIRVVAKRNLRLKRVKVKFRNGDVKTIHFYRDLKKNKYTDWRKFGFKRCVTHIEVFGNSDGTRAGVKVLGRQK